MGHVVLFNWKGQLIETITLEEALVLLQLPKVLGADENGDDVKVNIGRFGPYIQIKSEYFSLKEDDPYTIKLPRALEVVKEIKEQKAKALLKDFPEENKKKHKAPNKCTK